MLLGLIQVAAIAVAGYLPHILRYNRERNTGEWADLYQELFEETKDKLFSALAWIGFAFLVAFCYGGGL